MSLNMALNKRGAAASSRGGLAVLATVLLLMASQGCTRDHPKPFADDLPIPDELWQAVNHGRVPLREDGFFDFPRDVERVMVDVGAYKLKRSLSFVRRTENTAVVAVEPMREPWAVWPDNRRIIGVPAAISLARGTIEFNINSNDVTSSVLGTAKGGLAAPTIEVRRVPSVLLEEHAAKGYRQCQEQRQSLDHRCHQETLHEAHVSAHAYNFSSPTKKRLEL